MASAEEAPLLEAETEAGPPQQYVESQHVEDELEETTPLLDGGSRPGSSSQPKSSRSSRSKGKDRVDDAVDDGDATAATGKPKSTGRRATVIAIVSLVIVSVGILVGVYLVPAAVEAVESYAKQGVVFEPTNLALEAITTDGIRARIQANVRLDASRVGNEHVRALGRWVTWVIGSLSTEAATIQAHLPDYENVFLGAADLPPLRLSLVDGQTTALDIVADLVPGDADGLRTVANQWLEGRLDTLRVQGATNLTLRAGFLPLGTHAIAESVVLEASDIPALPEYSIDRILFEEVDVPGRARRAMAASVSISAFNRFPVQLDVPSLGFQVFVPNCKPLDTYILVADAISEPVTVRPVSEVVVEVNGTVLELPESLTALCPGSESSPLDNLLQQYLSGDEATLYVRGKPGGSGDPGIGTPDWIGDLLASVTVPVPFPGRTFDNLIRNFSMTDVHFTLPDPMAQPGEPGADPTVSGTILVTAALPAEMNFAINVTNVRANANVFYHDGKLGELHLRKWQPANSSMTYATPDHDAELTIQSHIDDTPLTITDDDVLADVIQALLLGRKGIELDIDARVDIRVDTVLGQLTLKDVPAAGTIPLKPPLPGGSLDNLAPQVSSLHVLNTGPSFITLEALVNITNPTEYTAHIPFINMHILCNGTILGAAHATNLDVRRGHNANIAVRATWHPSLGGDQGRLVGRDILSEYISGFNTSITIRPDRRSFPYQPLIGSVLSKVNLTLPTPRLRLPDDSDDTGHAPNDQDSFIRAATFHVISSTASFVLLSPLTEETLYIETINATAFYNASEVVGTIHVHTPFAVPPGRTESPKLPVSWAPDSVGFDKLRKALGGQLALDATAEVSVRLGQWREQVWYVGHGIGARVRP